MARIQPVLAGAWRASHSHATRVWHGSPGVLMAACLVLAVGADAVIGNFHGESGLWSWLWVLLLAFLCWRVVRRGWISRGILIWLSVADISKAAGLAERPEIRAVAALALGLAALLLLLSPAVYARTHPGCDAASSSIRLRPRRWMVLGAPLPGVAAAAVALLVPRRWPLPGRGCGIGPVQGLAAHCVGVGRGFPVAVMSTVHGHDAVDQLAFVQDCVQWTLLIFVAGYLIWLALHRRQPSAAGRTADGDLVVRPSQ